MGELSVTSSVLTFLLILRPGRSSRAGLFATSGAEEEDEEGWKRSPDMVLVILLRKVFEEEDEAVVALPVCDLTGDEERTDV